MWTKAPHSQMLLTQSNHECTVLWKVSSSRQSLQKLFRGWHSLILLTCISSIRTSVLKCLQETEHNGFMTMHLLYDHMSLILVLYLKAEPHLPLIMKLPVVKYSPVGAVLDTCIKQQKKIYKIKFNINFLYTIIKTLPLQVCPGSPGYDAPTKHWWLL